MSRRAEEVVRELLGAWAAGDLATVAEHVAGDAEWRPSPYTSAGRSYRGPEGFAAWAAELRGIALEIEIDVREVHARGDRVVVLAYVREGERDGPQIENEVGWVFDVEEEFVTRAEGFASWSAALGASGPAPGPGESAA